MTPTVSIIIPCYNEERFIEPFLKSVLAQDYPKELTESILIDGMSTDLTREIVSRIVSENPRIRLMDNVKRYAPFALNMGIRASVGEVIIRMDVHSEYPVNYVSLLVKYLYELNADNVGGVWIMKPGDDSIKALAIARAHSSPFGVGNAMYRLPVTSVCQVDTVPFGCYRREVFDRIGLFDEEMLRNQDDEFNGRLTASGGRIFLIPEIRIHYFARKSIRSIFKMHYQYGLFKPLGNLKVKKVTTMRQLVPPAFVSYLLISIAGSFFNSLFLYGLLFGMGCYLLADLVATFQVMVSTKCPLLLFYLPWIFFLIHVAYGWGYLSGIFKFVILRRKSIPPPTTR